ncbi:MULTISPECIES: DUF4282 domain-containing protein [Bacillaceae]|uniref:DUF4282 domain-containing protein n=1 Tax=Metabacillus sediminis TaxID=3117746 RepID=A0ABZ2NKC6_9BACI|nr:DUF4282 domain-containing protein [Bacillus sp. SJS]KZZ83597.1 hypothetical protein AS29_014900 [Bacillus sp. SJS]
MKEFLSFNKMITPAIITIIFYIGSGISVLTGLVMMFNSGESMTPGLQILMGLFTMLLGPFAIRIYCELLIVMFKMNESLGKIASDRNEEEEKIG